MPKSYNRKWRHKSGIIRQRGVTFQVEINVRGKRHREKADTLAQAKQLIEQKLTALRNEGIQALSLTADQRADAARAINHLPAGTSLEEAVQQYAKAIGKLDGATLDDAASFYNRHHKPTSGVKTVTEVMDELIAAKTKALRRASTIADIRHRVGPFAERFGDRQVQTITSQEIEDWLDESNHLPQTRINYLRVLSGFFNFARRQNLLDINPADKEHIERPQVDEHLPEIFTLSQVQQLLTTATEHAPRLIPYLCIGFFAGLRTGELEGLKWPNIDLDQRFITVRPEIAKRRRQRHVEMSDNLLAWLRPYHKQSGPVCPIAKRLMLDQLIKDSKVTWVHNGMRHTFASNHLAKHQDIAKTALQMGHTGRYDILFNHYRNLVKPADAEGYWHIMPPQKTDLVLTAPQARGE